MPTTRDSARIASPTSTTAIARGQLLSVAVLGAALAGGCTDMPTLSETTSEVTVQSYVGSGCSTAVVVGLSKQIADEVGCMSPGALVRFQPGGNLTFTSNAVLPYLSQSSKTALSRVTANHSIQVNSSYRTVVQQYLLYRWYQQRRCNITAAARPGLSNHQSGRALDVQNYSAKKSALVAQGFSHSVPGDPVHFDHFGSADIRGKDILAFQRLWNRNKPNDQIDADGLWGPDTERAIKAAPATGFAIGASCVNGAPTIPTEPTDPMDPTEPEQPARIISADVVSVIGPDVVAPASHAAFSITIANYGNVDIPANAQISTADNLPSDLYDANSWQSPVLVGNVGSVIVAGELGTIDLDIETPNVTEETSVHTQFAIKSGGEEFGVIDVAVKIIPDVQEDQSAEGDDQHDDGEDAPEELKYGFETTGGCSTGGSAGAGLLPFAFAALALRRRRHR